MARASTTSDAFNSIAEPRRREILSYFAAAERPVAEIVAALGLEQPSVSKHLRVLRDVGLGSHALPRQPKAVPHRRRSHPPAARVGRNFRTDWKQPVGSSEATRRSDGPPRRSRSPARSLPRSCKYQSSAISLASERLSSFVLARRFLPEIAGALPAVTVRTM